MKRTVLTVLIMAVFSASVCAQTAQNKLAKVYDETIDPIQQIDKAVAKAKTEGRFVLCQLGGNWCPWCLKFADFVTKDAEISKLLSDNFVYIHVNYNPRFAKSKDEATVKKANALMKRLNNAGRFGYPALVVLDASGKVIHIQDSSFLEEGDGYNKAKVLRFFKNWTPKATAL